MRVGLLLLNGHVSGCSWMVSGSARIVDLCALLTLLSFSFFLRPAYFITTLSAAVSHLQQLEVEEVAAVEEQEGGEGRGEGSTTPTTTLRIRPSRPRKDSVGSGGGGPEGMVGEEEDLLERWGPRFTPEETRRALEYLDGWLAMERNMEETIDLLEDGGWW